MTKLLNILASKKGVIVLIIIFILIGVLLRSGFIHRTDFWYDEGFTGTVIRQDWGTMYNILIEDKMHPLVYYTVLKGWSLIFGPSDVSLRSFSLIFGTLLIPLTYLFSSKLIKDKRNSKLLGLFSAFIITISPFFISYSIEARSYSLLMVFGALSAILFYKSITTSPYKFNNLWLVTIFVILFTFFLHYMSVIHIILYVLTYLVYILIDKGKFYSGKFWTKVSVISLIGYLSLTLIFSLDQIKNYVLLLKNRMYWIPPADLLSPIRSIYGFLFGVDRQTMGLPPVLDPAVPINPMNIAVLIFIIILICSTLYLVKIRNDKAELFKIVYLIIFSFGGLFIIALFSDFSIDMYVERYLSIYGWFVVIFVSYLAVVYWKRFSVLFLIIYIPLALTVKFPPASHPYTDVSDYIDGQMDANHVYSCDTFTMIIFNNYLKDAQNRLILYAPNNYSVFSKSLLYNTDNVVKDFNGSITGDAYICNERKDDSNRTFINEFDGGLILYSIN